ncbi:MAG: DUF72 domain-containing protein [Thaumarchaeota archaeon]|nr:MAG: DUF72 domain-containing protein [Nitrososphaerota archaeon]
MTIISGTCGWSYQEWVGAFYPNNRVAKLPFYSRVFNSVEVDSSFYRAPSKLMVAGWIRATGADFKFSLKIPQTVTHDKRLEGVEREFLDFVDLVEPIARAGKLGCLLLQLPPDFMFKERDSLESFFNLLPKDIHVAVEFCHESWNRKQTWDLLEKYGVANTVTDSPIEFLARSVVTATTHSYVRWHGRGKSLWYDYTYSEQELRPWLAKLQVMEEKVPVVYAYFNNHYRADAPTNLLQLLEMRGEITDAQKKVKARRERYERKNTIRKITDY